MLTTATRDYLIAGLVGLAVYSAAGLASRAIPGDAGQVALAPFVFAFTLLAFFMSGDNNAELPIDQLSGWQLAMRFVHANIWLVLTVASGLYAAHVLATRVWRRWCNHALKTPCTAAGMMAQEVCPNAQGPGFVGCVQEEAVVVTKAATADLRYATDLVTASFGGIGDALNAGRKMFDQIRTGIEAAVGEMLQRVLGAMVPAVRGGLSLKAMTGQLQGVLATTAYLLLAGLMGAKSFIGGFIQMGDTTVAALATTLAVLIVAMIFDPFLAIPAAVVGGILAAVSIPLALVTAMAKGLGISW